MNAPIREFVQRYVETGAARLHMPGHKGTGPLGCEACDITEIAGADALYEAEGIIAESEANATALFGTQRTCYATEGSSQCIRAMLHLALGVWQEEQAAKLAPSRQTLVFNKQTSVCFNPSSDNSTEDGRQNPGASFSVNLTSVCLSSRPVALAGRNAHRAFLTAAALEDFDVEWLWPETASASPCACPITPEGLARRLDAMVAPPFCVYVTSPDYLGGMLDIAALAEVCHARGVPLLVDNAHGAYLRFLPEALHPMELGADLCCDSAHKTLPVLTGGAYLHVGKSADPRFAEGAKRALALYGSTSPSYLILQSLDCANVELAGDFPERLARCRARVEALKATLAQRGFELLPSDPMKLTLRTDGMRAAELLRAGGKPYSDVGTSNTDHSLFLSTKNKLLSVFENTTAECSTSVEPELVEREHVVLMFSPNNTEEDFARVERALAEPLPFEPALPFAFPPPPRALSIREAMFSPCDSVSVEQAVNRVCASPTAACPPAIAIAVPGEVVTPEVAQALRQCGISRLSVVKQR